MSIVNSDAFLNLSITAQALYFHLGMRADDRGYVFNAKSIIRATKCSENDLKELIDNKFLLDRSNDLILIKAWCINNNLTHPLETNFIDDFKKIHTKKNGMYSEKEPLSESIGKRDNRDKSKESEKGVEFSREELNDIKENNIQENLSEKYNKSMEELIEIAKTTWLDKEK